MSDSVIAAQLYTLRDFLKTPAEIAASLKKVREIGYKAVQVSGMGPIDPKELRKITDSEGLTICATHMAFEKFRDETSAAIEEHQILGCKHPAVGSMSLDYRGGAEGFLRFARDAEKVGQKLADAGMTFSYHNHNFEFERFDGRMGMEIIIENTSPENVKMELDTYWVQAGGCNPTAWIKRVAGRISLLHLKDMAMEGSTQVFAEIGRGNLDWPEILAVARAAEVEWYIVEQDKCQGDPFDSLKISLDNLKDMGLK